MLLESWATTSILKLTSKEGKLGLSLIDLKLVSAWVYIPESAELSCSARRSKLDMTAVLESLLAGWWATYSTYPHFPRPSILPS
jgi:hypothetical protein